MMKNIGRYQIRQTAIIWNQSRSNHIGDDKYQLQSNESNYNHLKSGSGSNHICDDKYQPQSNESNYNHLKSGSYHIGDDK